MSHVPPPPSQPYGGYQYPPQQPSKSNGSKVLWIVLGVIGGIVVVCCGGGLLLFGIGMEASEDSGRDEVKVSDASGTAPPDGKPTDRSSESEDPADSDGPLGSQDNPVPRGKAIENKSARYEILDVRVTDKISYQDAPQGGRFVVVEVSVTNVKDETIDSSNSDFTLIVNGTQIEPDTATYALDDSFTSEDISPGLKRIGSIAFVVQKKDAGKGMLKAQAIFSTDEELFLRLR